MWSLIRSLSDGLQGLNERDRGKSWYTSTKRLLLETTETVVEAKYAKPLAAQDVWLLWVGASVCRGERHGAELRVRRTGRLYLPAARGFHSQVGHNDYEHRRKRKRGTFLCN